MTYGGAKQDIRKHYYGVNEEKAGRAVWENRKGTDQGDNEMRAQMGSTEWKLAVGGSDNVTQGVAVAKGKVYYHQLGKWEQPPNLFDPFWRAKLHPFAGREELNKALNAAGDSFGPSLNTPIEGAP